MLGIDTHILVRFLVRDDEAQFEIVRKRLEQEVSAGHRVFVSLLVLQETEWVLRSRYQFSKQQIFHAVSSLLDSIDFELEDPPAVEQAVFIWESSPAGFSDCLIGARNQRAGCRSTATFDAKASRLSWFVQASTGQNLSRSFGP
jgi:predicted nucleic-acid-binding protein